MIVMPSNNTGFEAGRLFERYPDRLAHLHCVGADVTPREPLPGIMWALDNGVYGAWKNGKPWIEEPFYEYLDRYSQWKPLWAVVPDWVGDRDATLRLWDEHWNAVAAFGAPLAFAVQDGMTPADVPQEAAVIFVGGTFSWKWRYLTMWTEAFPRVHVGRVNTERLLWQAHDAGAESCDGTGWFRGDKAQLAGLVNYLTESSGSGKLQHEMAL